MFSPKPCKMDQQMWMPKPNFTSRFLDSNPGICKFGSLDRLLDGTRQVVGRQIMSLNSSHFKVFFTHSVGHPIEAKGLTVGRYIIFSGHDNLTVQQGCTATNFLQVSQVFLKYDYLQNHSRAATATIFVENMFLYRSWSGEQCSRPSPSTVEIVAFAMLEDNEIAPLV